MKESGRENNPLPRIWVVVPAYNEETSIGQVLQSLCSSGYSIVVVDDCSKDSTSAVAMQYPVAILRHLVNLGQGAALQTGFDYIKSSSSVKCAVTFDSDGQHCAEDIQKVIEPIINKKCDVVLGSRFIGKKYANLRATGIPFSKYLTLKLGVLFTKLTTGLKVTDTHNGLRAFSGKALANIQITHNRMAHGSEILSLIAKHKLSYLEVPVSISYTEYSKKKGQSIFNSLNILWELFWGRDE